MKHLLYAVAVYVCLAMALLAVKAHARESVVIGDYGPELVSSVDPQPEEPVFAEKAQKSGCKGWRIAHYASHMIGDGGSTIAFVESGKGEEKSPLARALIGKEPSPLEVLGYKAITSGLIDLFAQRLKHGGNEKAACTVYKTSTVLAVGVTGFNMRLFIK